MAMEQVKAFLEKLNTDPAAQSLLKSREQPKSEEEKIKAFAEVATALGFQMTEAEITEYLKETLMARLQKTDAQAETIQKLDDSEIEKVSGGKDHPSCYDTYQDKENCWVTDGCDKTLQHYPDYLCNHNNRYFYCGDAENMNCQEVIA